jgi:L-fuconolactonase
MIVEWNAHMFSRERQRYPFIPGAAYIPGEQDLLADPLAAYVQRMEDVGIDRAVLVQPEPYGDDHRLVLDCLRRDERLKATCFLLPRDRGALSKLSELAAAQPRIVALRFHLHRGNQGFYCDSLYDVNVRALWERAASLGLSIELHVGPNVARQVADAVRDYPTTPVLIDHLAEPQMGTPEEYQEVLALGQFPNVAMKLSGLKHFSREPEPHLDAKPLVQAVAAAFGPERLAWSDGSPTIVDALLDHWSPADRARVKGANLARLAGFA